MRELTDIEEHLLEVWRQWPLDGQRAQRMNAYLGMGLSETRAVQIVNALLERQEAWEHDPVVVARLRRLRDSRTRRAA